MTVLEKLQANIETETVISKKIEMYYRIYILQTQKALKEELQECVTLQICSMHLKDVERLVLAMKESFGDETLETEFATTCFYMMRKFAFLSNHNAYMVQMQDILDLLIPKWFHMRQKYIYI